MLDQVVSIDSTLFIWLNGIKRGSREVLYNRDISCRNRLCWVEENTTKYGRTVRKQSGSCSLIVYMPYVHTKCYLWIRKN